MLKAHLFSRPLALAWANYMGAIKSSRQKASTKRIHALRVTTLKLEAILKLSRGLDRTASAAKLIQSLRTTRKELGPLRDLQVESKQKSLKVKSFSAFLAKEERKEKRAVRRYLNDIPLKKEKRWINKTLSKKLLSVEKAQSIQKMKKMLEPTLQSTLIKFNAALAETTPKEMGNLHKFRIHAKRLRYQAEALKVIIGATHFDLDKLKIIQKNFGKIQDSNALLQNMDRYLRHKQYRDDEETRDLKVKIERIQKRRIQTELENLSKTHWES